MRGARCVFGGGGVKGTGGMVQWINGGGGGGGVMEG